MKKFAVICSLILLAASLSSFLPSVSDMDLYDNVIRLHVIANSDSQEDQSEKLRVRDAVLEYVGGSIAAESKADAERELTALLPEIQSAAAEILPADRTVTVTLTTENYPRKSYGPVTLPAGSYTSLRVIIGSGSGHNWWGVIFPCFRELTEENSAQVYRLIGEDNFALVNEAEGVELRFHILELLAKLRDIF